MKRREFIALLGSAAAAWPLAARAQQSIPMIGFLHGGSADRFGRAVAAFRQALSEIGYVEGQSLTIEYLWAEGHYERLSKMAADLVRRHVAVIVAGAEQAAQAAKEATATTPIVFSLALDPVEFGLVASLNRPGGNLTGVTTLNVEVGPKRLELLHELVPTATIVALLVNPTNPNAQTLSRLQAAARTLGLQLHVLHASTEREIDDAFAILVSLRAGALVIGNDAFFNSRSKQLATLALRHAVPTIYSFREFAAAGGLMSYGSSITDAYRQVGVYTGKILKGASRPICRSSRPRKSSCSSISRPPRRSASRPPSHCSAAPTG